jgi:hypothetical protein
MTPTAKTLLILLALALSPRAHATDNTDLTAQTLYDMCVDNNQHAQVLCHTWIYGFVRGMQISQITATAVNLKPVTCFPRSITGEQAQLIIMKYLRDHPEDLHHEAAAISGAALIRAFPCKN